MPEIVNTIFTYSLTNKEVSYKGFFKKKEVKQVFFGKKGKK